MDVKRIIVMGSNGLGNQLFEYALGKYFLDKLGCDMVFDKSHFLTSKSRTLQLDRFTGSAQVQR